MILLISLIFDGVLWIKKMIRGRNFTAGLRFLSMSALINTITYYIILGLIESFGYHLLFAMVSCVSAKILVVWTYLQEDKEQHKNKSVYLLSVLLCLCPNKNPVFGLISGVILLLFVTYTEYQENVTCDEKPKTRLRKESDIYLKTIEDSYRKNRALMHDLKNHILALRTLAENKSYDELLHYMDSMAEKVSENLFPVHSGNVVLDAILADKYHIARRNGIFVEFLNVRYNVDFDNGDLCTVIGNLFDNAITENLKSSCEEERRISVSICSKDNELSVKFTNPLFHVLKIHNGLPVSDKPDLEHHGMGLKNVRRVCDVYDGALFWDDADGIFTVTAQLKMTRNP